MWHAIMLHFIEKIVLYYKEKHIEIDTWIWPLISINSVPYSFVVRLVQISEAYIYGSHVDLIMHVWRLTLLLLVGLFEVNFYLHWCVYTHITFLLNSFSLYQGFLLLIQVFLTVLLTLFFPNLSTQQLSQLALIKYNIYLFSLKNFLYKCFLDLNPTQDFLNEGIAIIYFIMMLIFSFMCCRIGKLLNLEKIF